MKGENVAEIEVQEKEQQVKNEIQDFLMLGGNNAEVLKSVVDSLQKSKRENLRVFELSREEMSDIVQKRQNEQLQEGATDYLENERNIKQARFIAEQFYTHFQDILEDGSFVEVSFAKKETQFSWNKFREVLATLDIFGHIQWYDDKKQAFRIILDDKEIIHAKKTEAQKLLDFCKGRLLEIQSIVTTKREKDKIGTIIKKMNLEFE